MANFGKLMKQAQEMQERLARAQEELSAVEVKGSSGGGMVTVRMNGQQEVLGVTIEEEAFKEGDREMLEDLIVAAFAEARKNAMEAAKEHMSAITGGMNIPGLF